jgi:hypothetical protein
MKAKVTITDPAGTVFEGEVDLVRVPGSSEGRQPHRSRGSDQRAKAAPARIARDDLSLPARAFMHRHARGRSGHEAFALLVAWLAKGEAEKEVRLEDVRREWDRMKGLLGGFAPIYATRAKDKAWVDSPGRGAFVLLPDWEAILGAGLNG